VSLRLYITREIGALAAPRVAALPGGPHKKKPERVRAVFSEVFSAHVRGYQKRLLDQQRSWGQNVRRSSNRGPGDHVLKDSLVLS
jgi:hypothetical protein